MARSKLPKKRRRVLPVEQPRRKREPPVSNRRVNAVKHGVPATLKEMSPGGNKFGVNGMNVISLALPGPAALLRPPAANPLPLQARAPTVEGPLINPSAAISLASLQPPLITAPPLQPRPATTGALDLMLPLQPKLLPGYLQPSFLSSTLSTVRPPDLNLKEVSVDKEKEVRCAVIIIENMESNDSSVLENNVKTSNVDNIDINDKGSGIVNDNYDKISNEIYSDSEKRSENDDEINSNVIIVTKTDCVLYKDNSSGDSPNNNSC